MNQFDQLRNALWCANDYASVSKLIKSWELEDRKFPCQYRELKVVFYTERHWTPLIPLLNIFSRARGFILDVEIRSLLSPEIVDQNELIDFVIIDEDLDDSFETSESARRLSKFKQLVSLQAHSTWILPVTEKLDIENVRNPNVDNLQQESTNPKRVLSQESLNQLNPGGDRQKNILPLTSLIVFFGATRAWDLKTYSRYKIPFSLDFLILMAREFSLQMTSEFRPAKKLLICDLDETLWGGVLDQVGIDRLEATPESPKGLAYYSFQKYLKKLSEKGILLAICSQNSREEINKVFEKNPDMPLKLSHFSAIRANFKDKAENIVSICEELSLSANDSVFIDDQIFEIQNIRAQLPEVSCVHMNGEAHTYSKMIQSSGYFYQTAMTEEDTLRQSFYAEEKNRHQHVTQSRDEFLQGLQLELNFREAKESDLQRLHQLELRTNQFNSCQTRSSVETLKVELQNPIDKLFCVEAVDRFGPYGLVSSLRIQIQENGVVLKNWCLSCRAFNKDIEPKILRFLHVWMKRNKISKIKIPYIKTQKNHYLQKTFSQLEKEKLNGIVFEETDAPERQSHLKQQQEETHGHH